MGTSGASVEIDVEMAAVDAGGATGARGTSSTMGALNALGAIGAMGATGAEDAGGSGGAGGAEGAANEVGEACEVDMAGAAGAAGAVDDRRSFGASVAFGVVRGGGIGGEIVGAGVRCTGVAMWKLGLVSPASGLEKPVARWKRPHSNTPMVGIRGDELDASNIQTEVVTFFRVANGD